MACHFQVTVSSWAVTLPVLQLGGRGDLDHLVARQRVAQPLGIFRLQDFVGVLQVAGRPDDVVLGRVHRHVKIGEIVVLLDAAIGELMAIPGGGVDVVGDGDAREEVGQEVGGGVDRAFLGIVDMIAEVEMPADRDIGRLAGLQRRADGDDVHAHEAVFGAPVLLDAVHAQLVDMEPRGKVVLRVVPFAHGVGPAHVLQQLKDHGSSG